MSPKRFCAALVMTLASLPRIALADVAPVPAPSGDAPDLSWLSVLAISGIVAIGAIIIGAIVATVYIILRKK